MSASNWVLLVVEEVVKVTDDAFLLLIDGEEYWLPRSQIADPDDYEEGELDCEMSVTKWIARQKGLI